jgi:hypothetical protein
MTRTAKIPSNDSTVPNARGILAPKDSRAFEVDCFASPVGSFRAGSDSLSVKIGQRISRFGTEEMWDSVIIQCKEESDVPTVRVLVCHPDWDEPLQVACIRSQPKLDSPISHVESLRLNLELIRG